MADHAHAAAAAAAFGNGTFSPLSARISPSAGVPVGLPGASTNNAPPPVPRPQMPPDNRSYFETNADTGNASANGKKRGRENSVAGGGRDKTDSPFKDVKDGKDTKERRESKSGKDAKEGTAPPSILVREKKQKACANCRRAKLKCIVENNEADCVRCRARKERCVFYPRGHDEDWQQTLTADVYTALGHLSELSAAVHHLMTHLTVQGVIPPLSRPLSRYEMPDRDLSVLQGWGAERNRKLGQEKDSGRKRRRTKKDSESDDDNDDATTEAGGVSIAFGDMVAQSRPGADVVRPTDIHMPPPDFERVNRAPSDTSAIPFAAPSAVINEVDIGFNYPTAGTGPASHPSGTGVTPDNVASISPMDSANFGVPVLDGGNSQTALTSYHNAQGGIFGLLNGSRPTPSPNSIAIPPANMTDSLGSQDPRPNIVKRGLIPNAEALSLVNYFHSRLSQWLFGYRLEFGKFPYIAQGPSVITPFILSVMCLVAAERVPTSHEHRPTLAREVTQLLVNSPADSFISTLDPPFGGGTGHKDEDGEEELDPELGIGPEEIVGACILATFMTERDQAATIASSAFKWARGWIKWTSLTVPLPPTLGEVCGLLPIKRDATREDMARVWLLCYIVDGTEALQRDNPPPPRRDPMAYCHVLVPDSPLPGDQYSPHDILLTFHARLITLLRDWYHRRSQNEAASAGLAPSLQAAAHARLASSINASLEWWRADLESHALDANWMRHINLFWEFARMLVNATSAKSLGSNPRLRAASWAHGVEAAVGFLEKCNAWPNRNELANLPPCFLSMITLAGSVLVDAIKDQGVSECPFQAEDAVPLLNDVADMLASGGLPASHVARTAGQTLRQYAEQLAQYV